jgi:hypothetical protein
MSSKNPDNIFLQLVLPDSLQTELLSQIVKLATPAVNLVHTGKDAQLTTFALKARKIQSASAKQLASELW